MPADLPEGPIAYLMQFARLLGDGHRLGIGDDLIEMDKMQIPTGWNDCGAHRSGHSIRDLHETSKKEPAKSLEAGAGFNGFYL